MIPNWWEFVLLALAAFRAWRLLAEDEILDWPRKRLYRLVGWEEGDDPPDGYREKLALFISCPWCSGFWLSLGIYLLWVWFPTQVMYAATVFALSAAVGLIRGNLDPPDD